MRIGVAKPDYGVVGGFELCLDRVVEALRARGDVVGWLRVPARSRPDRVLGVEVPDDVAVRGLEFFTFTALLEQFAIIDASDFDVVLATQPPSYAVDHPRKVALFYHHQRIYYDLSDVFVRAGFADPATHMFTQEALRELDRPLLASVAHFVAGSENVARRLERYNGIRDNVNVFHAALPQELPVVTTSARAHALCVSRHEFPKRTELFVHAMKFLPAQRGVAVGSGGRLAWVQSVDRALSQVDPSAVDPRTLWLTRHQHAPEVPEGPPSNVTYLSGVESDRLAHLYAEATCVVAPAFDEDYGLTAIEAMNFGKPVIVCEDGGGLVEMVEHGVNGFVVPPDGAAIADAIATITADTRLAGQMGAAGRRFVADFTWERAMRELDAGLRQVA